jgi:hypothetical protein
MGWPVTGVEAPYTNAQEDCEPPSELAILKALFAVGTEGYWWVESKFAKGGENQDKRYATWGANVAPTLEDIRLFGASIALLQDHLDLVSWAAGLVQSWSAEIAGLKLAKLIEWLLTPDAGGRLPFGVTYVSSAYGKLLESQTLVPANATGWAFTCAIPTINDQIGVIIPVRREDQPWMKSWLPAFGEGGAKGLCAVIQVATMILHEFVHIIGDLWDPGEGDRTGSEASYDGDESNLYGTTHEQDDNKFFIGPDGKPLLREGQLVEDSSYVRYPCWDECRMVASLFEWGMAQRYPCLASEEKPPGSDWTPGGTGPGNLPKIEPKNGCEDLGDPLHVALSFHPGR